MSTTLQAPSFAKINQRADTSLKGRAEDGDTSLVVESTQDFKVGQVIYVGTLASEGCEKAAINALPNDTTIELAAPLKFAHRRYEPVTAVLGDLIRIHRALDVNGTPPADSEFSVLATRNIDPERVATYYTDSTGSSAYWYKLTYWNEVTGETTALSSAEPVRGDDFGHYVDLDAIRSDAGFNSAENLPDWIIDQQRRKAESEVNGALSGAYAVPFKRPIPGEVERLTLQLAVALLLVHSYGYVGEYKAQLDDARKALAVYADGSQRLTDEAGVSLDQTTAISSYPDSDEGRMFSIGDQF